MRALVHFVLSSSLLALAGVSSVSARGRPEAPGPAGISNHGSNPNRPCVTAGDRAYLIGTQDGDFPDMGGHVPGEMGGLWLHPIKLVDGFWASVAESATAATVALEHCTEMIAYPYGTRFRYAPVLDGLEIERFQWSPDGSDGLVVEYVVRNAADRARRLRFRLAVKTDLLPVWFSEHLGIHDAPDTVVWRAPRSAFIATDGANPWVCVWGAVPPARAVPEEHPRPIATAGMGATAASWHEVSLDPRGTSTLTFVFAGSTRDEKSALDAFDDIAAHRNQLLEAKQRHYAALVSRARIRIPDARLQQVYDWVRIDAEWCVRDVPGMGRGLGAGLMEYPWWFGTETYSLQALTAAGDTGLVKQTLRLLLAQSTKANGNGRIVHEVTTNGAVSNPGNTQETAQFVLTAGRLIEWTGDLPFAREMYPAMKTSLAWLLGDMDRNHDLFPEGYGIMEVYGLNAELIDVAVYTQQALEATAHVARALHETRDAEEYQALATRLAAKINESFWIESEGSYADFYGTRAQAMSAADGAIHQIGLDGVGVADRPAIAYYEHLKRTMSDAPDDSRGWLTNCNWVIATPMEAGIAPPDRAIPLLDKVRSQHCGPYGPFLSAVEKGAMMTISTGVEAVAEANYGRTDQAMWYVNRIAETFNRVTPGSISEMMPDYGCFTIAWTCYGVLIPVIQHVFGIHADGLNRTIVFAPHLPGGWEDMSIEDLPVGPDVISFSRARTAAGIEYRIRGTQDGWRYVLKGVAPPGSRCEVNGRTVAMAPEGIELKGRKIRVRIAAQ